MEAPKHPRFGESGVADFYELLDLLAIVFEAMASAQSPYILQARMQTAATVFRDKYGMELPRADIYLHRLLYNPRAGYGARPTQPLATSERLTPKVRDWDDSNGGGGNAR